MKVRTSILIDKEVLTKAQQYGINVSKATENYLKILINIIERTHKQIEQQTTSKTPFSLSEGSLFPKRESSVMGSRGFEPRIASAPGWYPCPN